MKTEKYPNLIRDLADPEQSFSATMPQPKDIDDVCEELGEIAGAIKALTTVLVLFAAGLLLWWLWSTFLRGC